MALTLLAGPANAGKVALLLERYLAVLGREPFLIVPNRSDVDRVERELLASCGALLGGEIGTFNDLFARVARGEPGGHRPVATDAQRALIVRRVLARARLNGWTQSARYAGFADALSAALGELESGLVEPGDLGGDLAALYAAYRAELDRVGLWYRDLERRAAAERLAGELRAWEGRPVFAYGFEDLTGAQWALLEALAGRTEITVSLPYEPGRPAFASLERTADDLSRLASPRIEELPAKPEVRPPPLAHLERTLFAATAAAPPDLDGAIRFFEGAGRRGTLELVAEELLRLIRGGTRPEEIALVCPRVESYRAPLETALGSLGVPCSVEGRIRLDQTELGQALLSLLRFAWQDGGRGDLYGFLRSPYSGLARASVDWVEGRLRGRAVETGERTEEETMRLRDGHPLPALELVRKAATPLAAVQDLARFMLRAAYGLESPPVGERSREDLRAFEALSRLVGELEGWLALAGTLTPDEIAAALEREPLRAVAALVPFERDAASSLAQANGWERRLERALGAFDRPTRLTHPLVLEELGARMSFGVTELESFADCSSIWFVDRVVGPRTIDQQVDARLRGQVAHSALHKFFAGLPKKLGVEKLGPDQLDEALEFLRECLAEAMAGIRMELTDLQRRELEQGLLRDLEAFVRDEAASELQLVPRRFEVSFGSERSPQELQRGLDLGTFTLSGKIDRIHP